MAAISSLCVYCGSRSKVDEAFISGARQLGAIMADQNIGLVYGGGSIGLMGIIAREVLAGGGKVCGVIPNYLNQLEVGLKEATELVIVNSMHERKQIMFERADAFVAMPGGTGTLDELIEIITWRQLGLHDKPVVLLNINGYWNNLIALFDQFIDQGFASPHIRDLYNIVDRVEDVLPAAAEQNTAQDQG